MEIILKKDMPNIGLKNEVVEVKPGYGRNYLIPQGIAILATESAKKQHAELMKQRAHKEEKIKNEALALAAKLESVSLTVGTKASSTGKIFGSVNTIQIAESLAKAGYEIDRKKIILKDNAIKELGSYSCEILLYKGVKVKIALEVVAE
ncbi:MAG: 50S ribosomal protein L9 [Bacteroidales bacterium]|jgi:large subunit ribosomal protein L9|nr:50S ribosomal protein L9 [Bacteroidales bacterium]